MLYKKEWLQKILTYLEEPNQESLKLSLNNCHAPGLFSLVIDGTEHGHLTRIFVAYEELNPFDIALHTHVSKIAIIPIKGQIIHHTAHIVGLLDKGVSSLSLFKYKSPLNGGDGLTYEKEVNAFIDSVYMPPLSYIELDHNDFHTMSVSKGSIWIVCERGFKIEESKVLGMPFSTDSLYQKPSYEQLNNTIDLVKFEIRHIINAFSQTVKNEADFSTKELTERLITAQLGNKQQRDIINDHMKEYFTRFYSYKAKFTDLEWYHIFLDFYDKILSTHDSDNAKQLPKHVQMFTANREKLLEAKEGFKNRHTDGMPPDGTPIYILVRDAGNEHRMLCRWQAFNSDNYKELPVEGYLGTARVTHHQYAGIGYHAWEQNNSEFVYYQIVETQ